MVVLSPCFGRYTQLNNFTLVVVVVVVWGCGVEFGYEGNEGLLLGCGFPFTFATWEGELARLPWLGSILVSSILVGYCLKRKVGCHFNGPQTFPCSL